MAATSSQSLVARQGADSFKIDVGSPLWRHTTRILQVSRGDSYLWKCNYCQNNKGKPFNISYSRVKLHFMGPAGQGIAMCKGTSGKGLSNVQIASFVKEQEVVDKLVKRSKQSFYQPPSRKKTMQLPTKTIVSTKHPFLQVSIRCYSKDILAMPYRVAPYAVEEVANRCYKAFARLFLDDEMHKKVRLEFGLFASGAKLSPIAIKDQNDVNMRAITWWYFYGQPFKNLQTLPIKFLSQVASSSTAEQNWSTYSFIHSVKPNRLGSKKVEDLVYIHTNLRLLSRKEDHYMEGAAKLWDIELERANLDATIQDLTNIMTHGSSSTSGAVLGSNDLELAAVGGVGDDEDFFANPYDSDSD